MTDSNDKPSGSPAAAERSATSAVSAATAATATAGAGPAVPAERGAVGRALSHWFKLRREISRRQGLLLGVSCCVLCFGLWWLLTLDRGPLPADGSRPDGSSRLVSPLTLPSPRETFSSFPQLWATEVAEKTEIPADFANLDETALAAAPQAKVQKRLELLPNILATLRRVALGFLLATAVGVPIGILAGCFPPIYAFLSPVITFGRNIPLAAIVGLLFLILGTGELYKVMFIFVACVAFIISDTARSIADVSSRYVDTAYTLGATTWQVISRVLVPLALPTIFSSSRLLFGIAFGYIMLAESTRTSESAAGLGYQIALFQRRSSPEAYYMIVLIIPVVAFLVDQLLGLVQRQLFPHLYGSAGYLRAVLRWCSDRWEDVRPWFFSTPWARVGESLQSKTVEQR